MKNIKKSEFSNVIKTLNQFEEKIQRLYNKERHNPITEEFGYLIEKTTLEILKIKLNYSNLVTYIIENQTGKLYKKINEIFKNAEDINFNPSKPKIFQNYDELVEDLKKNEYVIVDSSICKLVTNENFDENKGKIKYEINSQNLILYLNDNEKVFFKQDSNIINNKNLLKENQNNQYKNENEKNEIENNSNITNYRKIKNSLAKISKPKEENNSSSKTLKSFLELYNFSKEIQNQLQKSKNSPFNIAKCYLIKKDFLFNKNNFSFYSEVYQYLGKCKNVGDENIFQDLCKMYESKIKENKILEIPLLDNENLMKVQFKPNYNNKEMIFLEQYCIINDLILSNIISNKFNYNNIKAFELSITEGKIIIKSEENKRIYIGSLGKKIFIIFIPEIILLYDNKEAMKTQFNKFQNNHYLEFEKKIDKTHKIADLFDEENKNTKIGEIYFINKTKYENLDEFTENIISTLNLNYKSLLYKNINDDYMTSSHQSNYFLINSKYINKLKEIFKYEKFLEIMEKAQKYNNNFNKIFKENKSIIESISLTDKNIIKKELEKEEFLSVKKNDLNEYKDGLFYFSEFEIISKDLKECLEGHDFISQNQDIIETGCSVGNKKVIIWPNIPDKFWAFTLNFNDKEELVSEALFEFEDSTNLENYLKILKTSKYEEIQSLINFNENERKISDDKRKLYCNVYEIKKINEEVKKEPKIKDDILNIIRIYLYNKDLINRIGLSKTEINGEKNKEYIFEDKCFLIDKNHFEEYKKYFLYSEIEQYLNNNINNLEIAKDSQGNVNSKTNVDIIYESIKVNKFFEDFFNKNDYSVDKKMFEIKMSNINEKNINYYDDFFFINEEIYKQIISNDLFLIQKKDNKFIINSGRIFIFMEEEKQILIGEFNFNNIALNILINFKHTNDFEKFQNSLLTKSYESILAQLIQKEKKLFKKEGDIESEIGSIFELNQSNSNDSENSKEAKKNKTEKQEIPQLLSSIYINFEKIKYKLENPFDPKTEYYIITEKWIKYLKQYFEYDKIISKLKENEKIKAVINKIKTDNELLYEKGGVTNLINQIFQNEKFNKIEINQIETIQTDLEIEKNLGTLKFGKEQIFYLDKFVLINNQIKKALKFIFNINKDDKSKFFIPVNYLMKNIQNYIFYPLKEHYFLSIGKFNENFIFYTKSILEFENKEIYEQSMCEDFINKEKQSLLNINNQKDKDIKIQNIKGTMLMERKIYYKLIKDKNNKNEILNEGNTFNNGKNIENQNAIENSSKNNIEKFLELPFEKDIKIVIKYIIFITILKNTIDNSGNKNKYKYLADCYLINANWIIKFNNFFLIEKLKEFMKDVLNNSETINKYYHDINSVNEIYNNFINKFPEINKELNKDLINSTLEDEKLFEIEEGATSDYSKTILYPKNFIIVNESVYNDLINRKNKNLINKKNSNHEIIINDKKIILNFNNKEDDLLIIGSLSNNNIFISELLLKFKDKTEKKELFNKFMNTPYETNIYSNANQFKLKNITNKKFQLIDLIKKKGKRDNDNNKLDENDFKITDGHRMVILFLVLYLHYEDINKIIKNEIKNNSKKNYYLINKNWMNSYKDYYYYSKICENLSFNQNKKREDFEYYSSLIINSIKDGKNFDNYIYEIIKNFPNTLLDDLDKKRNNQYEIMEKFQKSKNDNNIFSIELITFKSKHNNNFFYYGENEIISEEFFSVFKELESEELKKTITKEKIKCLIREEKIYIISKIFEKYPLINVGYYENNIFKPYLLIYYKDELSFDSFLLKLEKDSFRDFINNYKIEENEITEIKNIAEKKIIGKIFNLKLLNMEISNLGMEEEKDKFLSDPNKIRKINSESIKILKLIIYLKRFIKDKNSSLKQKELKFGFLIKKDFIKEIEKLKVYQIINNYIAKSANIQLILSNNLGEDIDILIQKIINEFDEKIIHEIQSLKEHINRSDSHLSSYEKIVLNKNKNTLNNVIL